VRFLGALAVMAWGSIILVSLSATVIFRYVDAVDPLMTVSILVAGIALARWVRSCIRARRPVPPQLDRTGAAK
jgi:Flp pilus assembly protein TadB